jgi:hypothetical protein
MDPIEKLIVFVRSRCYSHRFGPGCATSSSM